ncbi:hypothetical protein PENTCL1PPCAC_8763, partial [Pristionchus entomophagus]
PQFIDKLTAYAADIRDLLLAYAANMDLNINHKFCYSKNVLTDRECAQQVAEWVVSFERSIAMASWAGTELRNYQQQYTAFDDLEEMDYRFQGLYLGAYVRALLSMAKGANINQFKVVVSQPSYFAALDGMFDAGYHSLEDYINYLAIHF